MQGSSHASFTKSAPLVTSINQRYLKTKKLTLEYSTEVIQIFTALKVCVCVFLCSVIPHGFMQHHCGQETVLHVGFEELSRGVE